MNLLQSTALRAENPKHIGIRVRMEVKETTAE
jgi:hypothetical protein